MFQKRIIIEELVQINAINTIMVYSAESKQII